MSLKHTFKQGIHPDYHKELTRNKSLRKAKRPKKVVIPLQQHIGAPCSPLVKKGDKVKLGQKIGDSKSFVSAPDPVFNLLAGGLLLGAFFMAQI